MLADANRLLESMKRAALDAQEASKPVNIYFGEVISKSPLQINVEQKMILGENQLILTRNVTDYLTTVTVQWETETHKIRHMHSGGSGEDTEYAEVPHEHEVVGTKNFLIHNSLEKGDQVIVARQQEGQKFIVIDRIGEKR